MKATIITNLRIPHDEWMQVKTIAGELGLSANTLIREAIKDYALQKMLGIRPATKEPQATIWGEWKALATAKKETTKIKLSIEDEAIYSL